VTEQRVQHGGWWRSIRAIPYLATLGALVALAALGAPTEAQGPVAIAISLALPTLVGGEAWVRQTEARARNGQSDDDGTP